MYLAYDILLEKIGHLVNAVILTAHDSNHQMACLTLVAITRDIQLLD